MFAPEQVEGILICSLFRSFVQDWATLREFEPANMFFVCFAVTQRIISFKLLTRLPSVCSGAGRGHPKMYICISLSLSIYIYIYEREIARERCMYVYIYIYIHTLHMHILCCISVLLYL